MSRESSSPPDKVKKNWDVIGDIHGQASKLQSLLSKLGYRESGGTYRHPERRILFLGDYIDRGPDIRTVLRIVRGMVASGEAVALMGNHELNALHYHTESGDGQYLRSHHKSKTEQHIATLRQFSGVTGPWEDRHLKRLDTKWQEWLQWFARLPLFFETEDFRAIHACWSEDHIKDIAGRSLQDDEFLFAASEKTRTEGRAVEILLKGPELGLPDGLTFKDKDGHTRDTMRVRWWDLAQKEHSYASLVMPPGAPAPEGRVGQQALEGFPDYRADAKPVFCGHYWLPHDGGTAPLARNVMCLDFSAGKDGPLVACRWNGSMQSSEIVQADPAS